MINKIQISSVLLLGLLLGSADIALAQTVATTIPGANNDRFGNAMACVGPRLLVGSRDAGVGNGRVELFLPASSLTSRVLPNFAINTNAAFGDAVTVIERKSTGGVFGYAASAPFEGPGGTVYIYIDPGAGAFSSPISTVSTSSSGANFGAALADIGDQNNDGIAELAIGAPIGVPPFVSIVDPAAGAVIGASFLGNTSELFGASLASLSDLNSDGRSEVVIGGPGYVASINFGRVQIADPISGTVVATLVGNDVNLRFGQAVANIGDVNGDLIEDLVVGMPANPNASGVPGRVRVYDGSTLAGTQNILCEIIGGSGKFGMTVSGGGDVTGDGRNDFVVGDPDFLSVNSVVGKVSVFSFTSPGTCGEVASFLGGADGDAYGVSAAGHFPPIPAQGCDLTADGVHDFAFGFVGGDNVPGGLVIVAGQPAPTPTPIPAPTATATPTATPPPSTSGVARVTLRLKLNVDGDFEAVLKLSPDPTPVPGCDVSLLARSEVNGTLGKITELVRAPMSGPDITFSSPSLPRAEVENCVRPAIHIVARAECPGVATVTSNVAARFVNCGSGNGVTVAQWVANLQQGLQGTSTLRGRRLRAIRYRYRAPARARVQQCLKKRSRK